MSTDAGNREETTQNKELPLSAALFSLFLNFLFGANAVAAKISLLGMGVFTTVGVRFFLAAIAISLWAIITGHPLYIDKSKVKQLIILSVFFLAQIGSNNDGNFFIRFMSFKLFKDSKTVFSGHHQIQKNQIGDKTF